MTSEQELAKLIALNNLNYIPMCYNRVFIKSSNDLEKLGKEDVEMFHNVYSANSVTICYEHSPKKWDAIEYDTEMRNCSMFIKLQR